jgi:nucleotide-binding universal stress UspA family protein
MKIIVGVDDSPHSQAAVKWVREMRWPADTRFIVYSASGFPAYVLVEPAGASVYERLEQDQLTAHDELAAQAEQELRGAGLTASRRVERGDPREGLVHTAETEHADLIVVGSHGRTGFPRLIMGSVASHVVTHAPCTVTVVKLPRAQATGRPS